jgi:CubicO group peptidase (beta-lactamase class C family)
LWFDGFIFMENYSMNYGRFRSLSLFFILLSLITTSLPTAGYAQIGGSAATASVPYAAELAAIEQKAEAARQKYGIPGMSLVIVKDDKIIYMKGLGYKDFENKVAVTPDTQFAIGSATKAFTALSVLMAQDEGKLSLDDSPKKFLPYFKMYDPETDKSITIRDLLSHSSGLNRTDLAMVTGKLSRAELIQVAAQAKPTAKLREKFQYQNLMFTAAGEIVAGIEKKPWEKVIPERVLKPLGMSNTTMSIKEMEKAKDISIGYQYNFDTKETIRRPYRAIDEVAPAGSINSSARDMAVWLRFVMNGGVLDGKRLLSEASFAEWLKPQMKMSPDGKRSYSLGWFLEEWKGNKVVQHGGNIDGFNSLVAMVPEKKLGFVLLTNVTGSPIGSDLMPIIFDNIINGVTPEAAPVAAGAYDKLVGSYKVGDTGREVEVKSEGGKLILTVPGQQPYTLEPAGVRKFKPAGAPDGFEANFSPAEGDVTELELVQPGRTTKLPKNGTAPESSAVAAASTAAKETVGEYLTPGGTGTVEVKETDGKVTFNVAGQPPYELKDKAKDQFFLSGLPEAYWLRAKRDEAGKIAALVITQPEGEFEFKRKEAAAAPSISIDELMAKALDAAGGEANFRKLTSRVVEADVDLENQGVKATVRSYNKAPNKSATETTMTALGKTIATGWEYFDGTGGEEAYSFAPAEKFFGKKLADVRIGSDFYGPLNWKTNYSKAEVRGIGKVGGEEAYIVSLASNDGTPVTEYYSTKTFLLLKKEGFSASSTTNRQTPYTVLYSDYREVDGIKMPFRTVNNSVSQGDTVVIIRSVKHNVPVDDKLFAPKVLK